MEKCSTGQTQRAHTHDSKGGAQPVLLQRGVWTVRSPDCGHPQITQGSCDMPALSNLATPPPPHEPVHTTLSTHTHLSSLTLPTLSISSPLWIFLMSFSLLLFLTHFQQSGFQKFPPVAAVDNSLPQPQTAAAPGNTLKMRSGREHSGR